MERTGLELAHDLRMPLQIISSCAQLIQLEAGGADGRVGWYAAMLLDGVAQMRRMLNGALEDGGSETLALRNGDLVGCARRLCLRCGPWAERQGVALRFEANIDALNMALDADALSRVLLNLIANALRFTPAGGSVRVALRAMGDSVEIAVADTGPGIPPERLPRVFLRGETTGGHGHGLAIALRCARMMGGDLTAKSEVGRGSTFTLRLPVHSV